MCPYMIWAALRKERSHLTVDVESVYLIHSMTDAMGHVYVQSCLLIFSFQISTNQLAVRLSECWTTNQISIECGICIIGISNIIQEKMIPINVPMLTCPIEQDNPSDMIGEVIWYFIIFMQLSWLLFTDSSGQDKRRITITQTKTADWQGMVSGGDCAGEACFHCLHVDRHHLYSWPSSWCTQRVNRQKSCANT